MLVTSSEEPPPMPTRPPRRTRVLLVEDVAVLRRTYLRALTAAGYDVTVTSQGLEALHLAEESRPDVVLTEVSMPVMDGLTMITRLRERGITAPVLAMADDAFLESLALRAGADAFLVQPVARPALLDAVADLVRDARTPGIA
jgi:two-component system response regulator MprA